MNHGGLRFVVSPPFHIMAVKWVRFPERFARLVAGILNVDKTVRRASQCLKK